MKLLRGMLFLGILAGIVAAGLLEIAGRAPVTGALLLAIGVVGALTPQISLWLHRNDRT